MLTNRFDDAFRYAHLLHHSLTRKGTSIPYISHLMTVSALVVKHGGNDDQAIAALLHDAAEDQAGEETLIKIRARFGEAVAAIFADCTDAWIEPRPSWRARKPAYLAGLADKTHNAEAILFDRVLGNDLWDRFNGGADGTRWYFGAVDNVFASVMPGRLSDRLSRARRRSAPPRQMIGPRPRHGLVKQKEPPSPPKRWTCK